MSQNRKRCGVTSISIDVSTSCSGAGVRLRASSSILALLEGKAPISFQRSARGLGGMLQLYARRLQMSPYEDAVSSIQKDGWVLVRLGLTHVDQTQSGGSDHSLKLGMNAQLVYQMADMPLDRVGRDAEMVRHVGSALPLSQQLQDFQFPGCQQSRATVPFRFLLNRRPPARDRLGEQ